MQVEERTIGPYTLVRSLGRGGFGEVWLGERRSSLLTTQVALKLPILDLADIEKIRQEAQVWLRASGHPNIVPVLDAEVYDGQVVIASEYIAGGTLTAWLARHGGRAPSVEAAIGKTAAILSGLDFLHRAGLIHRDLKPDNVLLQDGAPRLTDFGLARFAHTSGQNESISGTPRYMAPESFNGSFSVASDLWSAGVVLYEMLTGEPPFPQQDILALITAVQTAEPPALPASVPARCHAILARLLARSPEQRFASAAEALAALQIAPEVSVVGIGTVPAPPVDSPGHNLPGETSSFIGREREQTEIRELLDRTRLLTLTGSGGCGKTRLALQVARKALSQQEDGVWQVELASITDPDLVARTVAAELGISETPGQPMLQTITAALRSRRLLIILDNCEHLLGACASLVDAILRGCPGVQIIATSREPLNVAGEQTYRVPSLALPEAGATPTLARLMEFEAIRLFADRARASSPDFTVTAENAVALAAVCRRLDGIPLAIELAAARTRSLTLEQIASRLDDRFRLLTGGSRSALPRQQTLRSLIDWSYSLLTEPERTLLRRLSVFAGGWSLEAAEEVVTIPETVVSSHDTEVGWQVENGAAGVRGLLSGNRAVVRSDYLEPWEILDLLTALGDKSLLVTERAGRSTRYRLLETVRQYAADLVDETGEGAELHCAHRDYYLALAEEAEPHFTRPTQGEWLASLDLEHDNLRAALDWCDLEEVEGIVPALRLTGALWRFWHTFGYLSEGRKQLDRALGRTDGTMRTTIRAKAMNGSALLSWLQGEHARARALYEESVAIGTEIGDQPTIAAAKIGLGLVMLDQGEVAAATATFEETSRLCAVIGDSWGRSLSLNNLGLVAAARGDRAGARRLHEEALSIRREMGDRWGISMSANNLGELASEAGDFAVAHALHSEALNIRREIRDRAGIAYSLESFAALAARTGDKHRSGCLLGAAETLRENIGAAISASQLVEHERLVAQLAAAMPAGEMAEATRRGRALTLEQAIGYALEG